MDTENKKNESDDLEKSYWTHIEEIHNALNTIFQQYLPVLNDSKVINENDTAKQMILSVQQDLVKFNDTEWKELDFCSDDIWKQELVLAEINKSFMGYSKRYYDLIHQVLINKQTLSQAYMMVCDSISEQKLCLIDENKAFDQIQMLLTTITITLNQFTDLLLSFQSEIFDEILNSTDTSKID